MSNECRHCSLHCLFHQTSLSSGGQIPIWPREVVRFVFLFYPLCLLVTIDHEPLNFRFHLFSCIISWHPVFLYFLLYCPMVPLSYILLYLSCLLFLSSYYLFFPHLPKGPFLYLLAFF